MNTFSDYLERYKRYFFNQSYTQKSWREYERNLSQLFEWLTRKGYKDLKDVTALVLSEYGAYLRSLPHAKRRNGFLSENTQIHKMVCIRALFSYLVEIEGFPLERGQKHSAELAFQQIKPREALILHFTPEQLRMIFEQAGSIETRTIMQVLLSTGVRISELLGCDLPSVSLEEKSITVLGKGHKYRTIPLTSLSLNALKEYLQLRGSKPGPLFFGKRGRLTYNEFYYQLKKVQRVSGIIIRPHIFRHTFATYMLNEGATIREVRGLLGHERLETTDRYTHLIPEETRVRHERIMSKYEPG